MLKYVTHYYSLKPGKVKVFTVSLYKIVGGIVWISDIQNIKVLKFPRSPDVYYFIYGINFYKLAKLFVMLIPYCTMTRAVMRIHVQYMLWN